MSQKHKETDENEEYEVMFIQLCFTNSCPVKILEGNIREMYRICAAARTNDRTHHPTASSGQWCQRSQAPNPAGVAMTTPG